MPMPSNDAGLHSEIARTGYELQHKRDTRLKKVDLHHHDFYEFYFLMSGEATCTVEGRLYRITPGDILLISPQELHKLRIFSELECYERYILWAAPRTLRRLSTKKTDLFQYLDPARPAHRNQLHIAPEDQPRLYGLVTRLAQEQQSDDFGSDLIRESLLTQILVDLSRIAAHQERPQENPALSSPIVSDVVAYIEAHCRESLTLEALAQRFFVSKYHLSHEFSRLMGTSVHRYILKKRLLIARRQLAQGMHPGEVWEPCGFGDYTGFYRAFEAEYGMSPRAYADAAQPQIE